MLDVLATPSLLRSVSRNCSEAADAPPHRCSWAHIARQQVLARESHGAFFLRRELLPRESEPPGNPSPRGQGWHKQFLDLPYEAPCKLNSMFYLDTAPLMKHLFPIDTSTSSLCSMIKLEYVACLLHCEIEGSGGSLEQVPYAHAI